MLRLFLRKWTEPSQNTTLAPPGWKLARPNIPGHARLEFVPQLG